MKMKYFIWLLILFIAQQVFSQEGNRKEEAAQNLLDDYQTASRFKKLSNGAVDPAWESMFKNLFAAENVIFDIPINRDKKPHYLKYVKLNRYIGLVREIYLNHPETSEIQYEFIVLGKGISEADSGNRIVFEIEKRFANTSWSEADNRRYLFEVQFISDKPKITSVKLSDMDMARNRVDLFFEQPLKKQKKRDDYSRKLFTRLKIDFDENVFDRTISAQTDSTGRIRLGQIATRARIIIDTVYGQNGERFRLPSEWTTSGKMVNSQPAGGFKILARPYRWSGWNLTVKAGAGPVIQSEVNTVNFSADSKFESKTGYDFGGGFTLTRFFFPENWRRQKHNWIPGVGTGVSFHYTKYKVDATQFTQNAYPSSDRAGDTCEVLIMGRNYEETLGTAIIKIPLYAELRKKVKNRFLGFKSFSLQAGANFMIPFLSRFRYEGIFSRHGRYPEFNNQVITDDSFYNYYTNQDIEDDGVVDYKNFMVEGMVRFNGFIPLSDKTPDHSLVVSLEFLTPFSNSTSRNTSAFLISSGNEEFESTAYSKEKLYEYYFGISVGLNFINYRPN